MFQYLNYRGARRKRTQKEIEDLFEQIMKENFPNLAKEIDFQEDQEAHTPRHIVMLPKIKYKERILKEARGKARVTYKGIPVRLSADFSKEILQARRGKKYSKSWKSRSYIQGYSIQQSFHLEWKGR